MKKFLPLLFILPMLYAVATAQKLETPKERAARILSKIDDMWRGKSSRGLMAMKVKTQNYTRELELRIWSQGKEKSLVIIESPLREKNTATLKSGPNIYSYLPKTDRTIRLTSGMMVGNWMGSHFTNDDLVKESRMSDDYNAIITFEGNQKGNEVIEFTLFPKPNAAVVWGKIIITAKSDGFIPIHSKYYDEDMALSRTMAFSNIKSIGGRMIPATLRVIPKEKTNEFTELTYKEMEFDIDLPSGFFSIARLRRR